MRDFIDEIVASDKTIIQEGTPINRAALMGIQGFDNITTVFTTENQIKQTNDLGETRTITFYNGGKIFEKFVGQETITKTTAWRAGEIIEVLS